ncbi:toxin-antitoxin system HicB family antitoxin [Solicola gregarius]|uniref:Toxin-antitoxin system HicB family antitoxin n=1 Tax=Solicola gregarius TaxID=2908642 RepID=A0AA46TKS2_9ACTN|nr:toxin-antitoxin system HicB family antitoxin [Solicola gregarius]UYM07090.1 toxin-antitoxin system HicB family antitoxin [Solicola gregarius]
MNLSQYVERLRADLTDAAAAGDDEIRSAAERLAQALSPSTRMVMLEALSDATAEITSELEQATVEVRLKGREPEFVVSEVYSEPVAPPPPPTPPTPPPAPGADDAESDVVARVTVRIPEWLKARAEDLATEQAQSLNAWIVNAIKSASGDRAVNIDLDLGSGRINVGHPYGPRSRRVQGWAR